jgi:hypothetical protein
MIVSVPHEGLSFDDELDSCLGLAFDAEFDEPRDHLDRRRVILLDQPTRKGNGFHGLIHGTRADRLNLNDLIGFQRSSDGAGYRVRIATRHTLEDVHVLTCTNGLHRTSIKPAS